MSELITLDNLLWVWLRSCSSVSSERNLISSDPVLSYTGSDLGGSVSLDLETSMLLAS